MFPSNLAFHLFYNIPAYTMFSIILGNCQISYFNRRELGCSKIGRHIYRFLWFINKSLLHVILVIVIKYKQIFF